MALQPDASVDIDRATTAPFLLRLFWRRNRALDPREFSVAPPADPTSVTDYSSILPPNIKHQSVQIYTWPNCTLGELTALFTSVLPPDVLPDPAVGTRLVFKLIFPDTRATTGEGGRGKWIDKPLGNVVIGAGHRGDDPDGDAEMNGHGDAAREDYEGDASKTLAGARFVIGDYIACSIYPPGEDGRVAENPYPNQRGPPMYGGGYGGGGRGPPPPRRDDGYGGGGYGRNGGYRGGYGGRGGGLGAPPPPGDWNRGERPPGPNDYYDNSWRGNGAGNGGGGGGYRGSRGRPY